MGRVAANLRLGQSSILQSNRAIHLRGEFQIMGRDQRGQTGFTREVQENVKDLSGRFRIKISRRFIRKQQVRRIG